MLNVFIQQNIIAKYRQSVFAELSSDDQIKFTILAGSKADVSFINLIDEKHEKIRVKWVKTRILWRLRNGSISYQNEPVRMAFRERPDLIIAGGNPYWITSWALLGAGVLLRIPVLLWGHGLIENEAGPKWWIRRSFYKLASGLLLYGDRAKELLIKKGFEPRSLYVVYNSLDLDAQEKILNGLTKLEIKNYRIDLGVGQSEGLVGFIGRLEKEKQLDLLVRAVSLLSSKGRRVHVALVGEGAEHSSLSELAQELGVSDLVNFMGYMPEEREVGLVLSACDVSVIPSWAGLSVMHAMAYGTPVITHNNWDDQSPEVEAVIEGVTGFFYEQGNVKDLAAKIEASIFRAPLKEQTKENCRKIIQERYSPRCHANAFKRAVLSNVRRKS